MAEIMMAVGEGRCGNKAAFLRETETSFRLRDHFVFDLLVQYCFWMKETQAS